MANPIVIVNVSEQVGPTPSRLQGTGAFISQGATNTSQGTYTLLTQLADLTTLLAGSNAITSLTATSLLVTAVTTQPHGFPIGEFIPLTIAGASPASFNGTYNVHISGTTGFTYATVSATGSASGTLVYTEEDVAELVAMTTTFFSQGSQVSVYVLELGEGNSTDGATFLGTWIASNSGIFYSYLVPRYWDGNSAFLSLIATLEAPTAKTYFWVTTTLASWQIYTNLMKCVNALIESPSMGVYPANVITAASAGSGTMSFTTTTAHGVVAGNYFTISGMTPAGYNGTWLANQNTGGTTLSVSTTVVPGTATVFGTLVQSMYGAASVPSTEFSQAAAFWKSLSYQPTSTNKVAPFGRSFVFGVTPFPGKGNSALLTTLKAANISIIGTGAQGGISNTLLLWGNMLDGNPFNYWYSADYAQINIALNLSNAVINGSNNPVNPLYLNQAGITTLEGVVAGTMSTMISVGLALGQIIQTALNATDYVAALNLGAYAGKVSVNAVPFVSYFTINPGQYKLGEYNGFSVTYTPLRGFDQIQVNLVVTDFVAGP